jgi:succinate dehydrogenase / fumarate reductase, cytochrome b subunit
VAEATVSSFGLLEFAHQHDFLLRRLHSLTGLLFGGYIVIHLVVNATLAQGGTGPHDIFQAQVDKIHSLPFLWAVEWAFIYLPIIYHAVYGCWIIVEGRPNVDLYPYTKNYFYLAQRISAIVIVLFLLFHVLGMKGLLGSTLAFDPDRAALSTARNVNSNLLVAYLIYPLGILASCYHLANGFWTAAITWGLTVSAAAQRRWGVVCTFIFAFTMICGFLALGAAIHDRLLPGMR